MAGQSSKRRDNKSLRCGRHFSRRLTRTFAIQQLSLSSRSKSADPVDRRYRRPSRTPPNFQQQITQLRRYRAARTSRPFLYPTLRREGHSCCTWPRAVTSTSYWRTPPDSYLSGCPERSHCRKAARNPEREPGPRTERQKLKKNYLIVSCETSSHRPVGCSELLKFRELDSEFPNLTLFLFNTSSGRQRSYLSEDALKRARRFTNEGLSAAWLSKNFAEKGELLLSLSEILEAQKFPTKNEKRKVHRKRRII